MNRQRVAGPCALLAGWFAIVTAADASFCGKYRGLVTDVADPMQRGRLQVIVPSVSGELRLWALPNVPFGRVELPSAGDEVWIAFEACDPQFPVWEGSPIVHCSADKGGVPRRCTAP